MIAKNDPDTIKSYLEDSSNLKGGHADKIILPQNIEELQEVLTDAYSKNIPVTISGGGTNTTGSRIPFGGIAVSMEKFNRILDMSDNRMECVIGAGTLVEDLKKACEDKRLFYTSHPTEKTAFVGGTIATNASGARSFKYGATRRYVKRLKMVLASGEMLDIKRGGKVLTRGDSKIRLESGRVIDIPLPTYKIPKIKSSAGYFAHDEMDPIDLFIGQEGTLSVIVEADLGLVMAPAAIFSSFVFFKKPQDAWNFAKEAKDRSKARVSVSNSKIDALSIEYFDSNALELLRGSGANIQNGVNAAIFFEQEIDKRGPDETVEAWMKLITGNNASADDTWAAMNEKESQAFMGFRHAVPESVNDIIRRSGFQKLSTDIAVPDAKFYDMMNYYVGRFKDEKLDHVIFGHIGECHLHVNILPKTEMELERAKKLALDFVRRGVSLGGTVSAEHGIGKLKHRYLEEMYGRRGVLDMVKIKKALDPHCILGLDNIFPKELLK